MHRGAVGQIRALAGAQIRVHPLSTGMRTVGTQGLVKRPFVAAARLIGTSILIAAQGDAACIGGRLSSNLEDLEEHRLKRTADRINGQERSKQGGVEVSDCRINFVLTPIFHRMVPKHDAGRSSVEQVRTMIDAVRVSDRVAIFLIAGGYLFALAPCRNFGLTGRGRGTTDSQLSFMKSRASCN